MAAAKKLARKLAGMTEEERSTFLENQKQQEELVKKKKEEMLYKFLQSKMVKEEAATKVNMLKVQERWRIIMRKSKHIIFNYLLLI